MSDAKSKSKSNGTASPSKKSGSKKASSLTKSGKLVQRAASTGQVATKNATLKAFRMTYARSHAKTTGR